MSLEPFDWVDYGVVFHVGRHDDVACRVLAAALPEQTLDGKVVALGAASGENHLTAITTNRERDLLTRVFEHHATALTERVS